jgi:hypothetical protein
MLKNYGLRVWGGDTTTVAEARAQYFGDSQGHLMTYAVALFSFRYIPQFAREMELIHLSLVGRANALLELASVEENPLERANDVETLSSHLEYLSHRRRLEIRRGLLLGKAVALCELGLKICSEHPLPESGLHTPLLLKLMRFKLYLLTRERSRSYVRRRLTEVIDRAPDVPDPNQRARVYRKIGMVSRKAWAPFQAHYWGVTACCVPGIPLAVRLKSFAALAGIEL